MMRRTTRRAVLSGFVAAAVAAGSLPLQGASPAHTVAIPALTAPLTDAATELMDASLLPELNQLVPGLQTNPAQLFGLHDVFGKLAALPDAADLEQAVDGLDGAGASRSATVSASDAEPDTLAFDLAIDKDVPVELGVDRR